MLLDQLLDAIDVAIDAFSVCRLETGWQLAVPELGTVGVHYVLDGAGRVVVPGAPTVRFERQAVIIVPGRCAVRLEPDHAATKGSALLSPIRCDDAEDLRRLVPMFERRSVGVDELNATLTIASGRVRARYSGQVDLFTHLRQPLVVQMAGDVAVDQAFEGMLREHVAEAHGGKAMMSAYMTQGVIAVLRRLVRDGDARLPWLMALEDKRLGRALSAMLDNLAAPHSLESLAKTAGMSRSSFSEHFSAAFGVPAMDLLREARIRRAMELLRSRAASVQSVARNVGFSSRSAFSRAFKNVVGTDPSSFAAADTFDPDGAAGRAG